MFFPMLKREKATAWPGVCVLRRKYTSWLNNLNESLDSNLDLSDATRPGRPSLELPSNNDQNCVKGLL